MIASALLNPSKASAKGFYLVTWGETIIHVGDASPHVKETHGSHKVGYKYHYFGVFWIDLWTQEGTYCVYDGKRYTPISSGEAAGLLGMKQNELSTPFLYQVPLGWLMFGPFILLGMISVALNQRSSNDVGALFQDPRYQRALEILNEQYAHPSPMTEAALSAESPAGTNDAIRIQAAFEAAVRHLVWEGIPRAEAERNLATLIRALPQTHQQ